MSLRLLGGVGGGFLCTLWVTMTLALAEMIDLCLWRTKNLNIRKIKWNSNFDWQQCSMENRYGRFRHVFREANQAADRVAKLGLLGSRRLWKNDLELSALIRKVALGWPYSRSTMAT